MNIITQRTEAITWRYSVKKVFLKISQNSQKKRMWQSLFLNKVAGLRQYLWAVFLANIMHYLKD